MTEGISTSKAALQTALEKSASRGALSPRAYLLEKIGGQDAGRRTALEEKLQGLEKAYESMRQSRQDMTAARKEAARRKIAQVKAQMQALQLSIGGDADSRARKIARLARELAAAVKAYKAAGGQDNVQGSAMTAAGTASPSSMTVSPASDDMAAVPDEAGALRISASLSAGLAAQVSGGAPQTNEDKAAREADKAFAEEARRLIRQLKNMQRRGEDNGDAAGYLGQAMRTLSGLGLAPAAGAVSALDVTV